MESLPDAALVVGSDGVIVGVNSLLEQLCGHAAGWLVGQPVEVLVPVGDRQRHEQYRRHYATEPARRRMGSAKVVALARADGHELPVDVGLAPVDAGRVLAVVREATAPVRVESDLRQRARLLDAIGQAVVATDLQGRIEYWNTGAERLYGWSATEVVGRDILEVTPSHESVPAGQQIMDQLRRGKSWTGEFTVQNRHGRRFPVWVVDTPFFDQHGELAGVIGVSSDISDLREAQQAAQRRARQQHAVAELGQEVLDAHDLDAVLRRGCEVVADELDVELVKVLELDPAGQQLVLRAGLGWRPGTVGHAQVAASRDSQAGFTLEQDGPVVVADAEHETRFTLPSLLVDHGVASGISVVIPRVEERFGVLGAHSLAPRRFSEGDAAFVQSVANVLGAAVDRHAATRELERLALSDALTGLANRTLLLDRLTQTLARAATPTGGVALAVADVAGFQLINDALGRSGGDRLLVQLAARLQQIVPAAASVARIGDDEFVVLVDDLATELTTAGAQALALTQRLEQQLAGHYDLDGQEVFARVRIGVAVRDRDGTDAEVLLRGAETALAETKQPGARPVRLYQPGMDQQAAEQLALINALQHATEHDEFFVVYQPKIDLRTGALFGLEALVRWAHPRRGVLSPAAFLDTAERADLLGPLGQQVLEIACYRTAQLPLAPTTPPPAVGVNISAPQLLAAGFVKTVDRALDATGLAADRLVLEVTERAIISDHERALHVLGRLRDRGIRIALDDFGTGYSSLTHLAEFPLDLLKIDRSFTARLTEPGRARAIVEATLTLAHTLGITCIAEGVETPTQAKTLTRLGCELAQGYLWARPLDDTGLDAWLTGRLPPD